LVDFVLVSPLPLLEMTNEVEKVFEIGFPRRIGL
jgi:hypothetical protein